VGLGLEFWHPIGMKNEIGHDFNCVEMKRQIQAQIYEETKGMSREQYRAYLHDTIRNSQFASWLDKPIVTELPSR
jgi:hypothetical protein